jgi:hypothetical protein
MSVAVGKTLQFAATVTGTSNTAVSWSVVGGGAISTSGLYTAPGTVPNPAKVTITATSQADIKVSGNATANVISNVSVTVTPSTADVPNFGKQQFNANVMGTSNTAVTWQVNGVTGGSRTLGFVSTSGLYVAPSGAPTKADHGNSVLGTFNVTAVSQADSSASNSATVTILAGNQKAQAVPVNLGTSGSNTNDSNVNSTTHTITCCGGTLGSLVTRNGTQYILSNNHVLARSDAAKPGDLIVQPGLIDTGTCTAASAMTVAKLSEFLNLESPATPKVDAAIAQVIAGEVDPTGNILYLGSTADAQGVPMPGAPHGGSGLPETSALIGRDVAKSGRTTGLTCSKIDAINVMTSVQYTKNCDGSGTPFTVNYSNQVNVHNGSFSAEGDSGSLIVTQDTTDPVALLFAGSDTDTVGNPIGEVLNFFKSGSNNLTLVGGAQHQVIGCTLPNAPQSAKTTQAASLSTEAVQKAVSVRDAHASELMARPEVQAVGVGASYDNPKDPAVVFFVTRGQPHASIPAQIDGVRTRIVESDLFPRRGTLSAEESAANEKAGAPPQDVYEISEVEYARSKVVHTGHADELMKQPGVQGVGITSSVDAPGEAALMIFLIRGAEHGPIPPVIDGLRTRVRESSRFHAGNGDARQAHACSVPAANNRKSKATKPQQ